MRLSKKQSSALLALTISLSSCQGIKFDPDFALPNLKNEVLVHEDGTEVSFKSREMLEYACMHESKVRELADILNRYDEERSSDVMRIHRSIQDNIESN